jgi:hypothetical protein
MKATAVECFDCFKWCIPTAFTDSLNQCRFEAGDVFHDSQDGYLPWEEAIKKINYTIQVKFPPSTTKGSSTDSDTLFEDNWKSPVVLTLIDHQTKSSEEIATTQGHLYTFLWKANLLDLESLTPPSIPLTCLSVARRAETAAYYCKTQLAKKMEKPNIWLMAYDPTNPISQAKYLEVKARLKKEFSVVEKFFTTEEVGLGSTLIVPTVQFVAFAIDLGASQRIADALKEVLYKPPKNKKTTKENFRLASHGTFLPSHEQTFGDLVTISFKHSKGEANLFYRYRVSKPKLEKSMPDLKDYLNSMTVDCPNHFFLVPPYCSDVDVILPIKLSRERTHELTNYAGESLNEKKYKSAHENVQTYLLEKDSSTIATEVPVWATSEELEILAIVFSPTSCTLTGHIDVIRFNEGFVEIWDYKPAAFQEKYAASQVFFYALMLSKRTGIPLSKIKCGYFDPSDAFTFNAEEAYQQIKRADTTKRPKTVLGATEMGDASTIVSPPQ